MKVIKVENMQCEKCVERITKGLNNAKLKFKIDLENKTVVVEDNCVKTAIEEFDDLGFDTAE